MKEGYHTLPLSMLETIGERSRPLVTKRIEQLVASMGAHGQRTPIIVQPVANRPHAKLSERAVPGRYQIIAGAARVEAARRLGWQDIDVKIYVKIDRDEVKRLEIDDNLDSQDLTKIELCFLLAERKRLYLIENPETAHGGDRGNQYSGGKWQNENFSSCQHEQTFRNQNEKLSFSKFMAERLHCTSRAIEMLVRRGQDIDREAGAILVGIPAGNCDVELDEIAGLAVDRQIACAHYLSAAKDGERRRVKHWKNALYKQFNGDNIVPIAVQDLTITRLQELYERASSAQRQAFLAWLSKRQDKDIPALVCG